MSRDDDDRRIEARRAGEGFFPGRAAIDAYGNGGFRFAGMSHRGSILLLPSGILSWHVSDPAELDPAAFSEVIAGRDGFDFLLLGTGARQVFPSAEVAALFDHHGLGLDAMATGAAARTYNLLLAEGRRVAAALIAVR